MKLPNLKNLDYKQIGINHGEKFAIAIIGLLLVFVLWSTKWARPVAQSPAELMEQATGAEEKIKKQPWPEAESKALQTGAELSGKVTALLTPLELTPWVLTIPLSKQYHPDRTLITKPKWLPVRDLVADAQVVELEMDPKIAPLEEGFKKLKEKDATTKEKAKKGDKKDKDTPAEEKKPDVPEDLKRTSKGNDVLGMGGTWNFREAVAKKEKKRPSVANRGKRSRRGAATPTDDEAAVIKVADQQKKAKIVGRGYHVVVVRGVFPLREQVTELMRMMGNTVTRREAKDGVQMHDFKLERQVAKPGPDPWSGPWEPIDRQVTLEMFHNDIFDFAAESVLNGIVDNHICMPLPVRLIGEWGRLATHPAVKEFVLSPDEIQTQVELQRQIIDKMVEEDKKKHEKDDKGGFAEFTRNPRKIQNRAAAVQDVENMPSIQTQIVEDIAKNKNKPSDSEINAKLTEFISKHASVQDHLLLFRYADFTVEPGKIYRYRVKLVVENPFHQRHAEEVSDPSLIEGETRDTDEWSEPTKPVYVPEDARFFVSHVFTLPGRSSLPNAQVDLYQWFASTGTVVNLKMVAQIGQLVGGTQRARVINPAEESSDEEWVPFSTNDALIDVVPGFSLDPALHRDIISEMAATDKDKKSAAEKERRASGTMVPDELVFVDENGALRRLDGLEQQNDHKLAKQRYEVQTELWDSAKPGGDDRQDKGRLDGRPAKKPRKSARAARTATKTSLP